ncbi:unnamed protein product [Urochloa humidicola]
MFAEIDLGAALDDNIHQYWYVRPTPCSATPSRTHAGPHGLLPHHQKHLEGTARGEAAARQRRRGGMGMRMAYPSALSLYSTRELSTCRFMNRPRNFCTRRGLMWLLPLEEGRLLSAECKRVEKTKLGAQSKDKGTRLAANRALMVMVGKAHLQDRDSCEEEGHLHNHIPDGFHAMLLSLPCAHRCASAHASAVTHVPLRGTEMSRRLHDAAALRQRKKRRRRALGTAGEGGACQRDAHS